MLNSKLTIIVTTYNCESLVLEFAEKFKENNSHKINMIIVDGQSTDNTFHNLKAEFKDLDYVSLFRKKCSLYEGLNFAIKNVVTPYYLVLGIDDHLINDIPTSVECFLEREIPLISAPVFFGNNIRLPKSNVWWRRIQGWFKIISNHSGGCLIKKSIHDELGYYNCANGVLADGHIIQSLLIQKGYACVSCEPFVRVGDNGVSANNTQRNKDTYQIMSVFYSKPLQFALYILRVFKGKIY
jgi:glycosyltransferase involved in cell wall biosynthesis